MFPFTLKHLIPVLNCARSMKREILLASAVLLAAPAFMLCRPLGGENLVDLSYVYDESTIGWLTDRPYQMTVTANGTTELGNWLQNEEIATGTHVGTHIDAPCHMARGRWTLDNIPLTHLIAPAAVVDMSYRAAADPDALLQVSDLERWERMTGYSLNGSIVLVRTGWGSRWPDRGAYIGNAEGDVMRLRFPGVSPEAALWLRKNRRIYGLGIDTFSLDSGFNTGRGVPAHLELLGANIFGLENVANLHRLPEVGVQLHVSPMKLGNAACGSPARIVAIIQ